MVTNATPDDSVFREMFSYDPTTGFLFWKVGRGPIRPGTRAGSPERHGHLKVTLWGRNHKVHRIAWFLYYGRWPVGVIDHINRITDDNRIFNLRDVSRSANKANSTRVKANKHGFMGVSRMNRPTAPKAFNAKIIIEGKYRSLGYFATAEEAGAAYEKAARAEYGRLCTVALLSDLPRIEHGQESLCRTSQVLHQSNPPAVFESNLSTKGFDRCANGTCFRSKK